MAKEQEIKKYVFDVVEELVKKHSLPVDKQFKLMNEIIIWLKGCCGFNFENLDLNRISWTYSTDNFYMTYMLPHLIYSLDIILSQL